MASGIPTGLPDPNAPPTGNMRPTAQAAVARTAKYYVPGANDPGPDQGSADYNLMAPLWKKVIDFASGTEGMRKTAKSYLPKFSDEDDADYNDRVSHSPFTNVYDDISSGLAAKPFSREVQFDDPDDVEQEFLDLYENIDGRGNNLHVFGETTFRAGLDNAIDWILVDYTKLPPLSSAAPRSLADEQRLKARPYWVRVAAVNVKAVYSAMIGGEEVLLHVRFYEPAISRDGYGETVKERYRIFNRDIFTDDEGMEQAKPATWQVVEKQTDDNGRVTWVEIDAGEVSIKIIPMVPFIIGKRIGNGWAVEAPLAKLTDMQVDAFRQESNLRNVELLTCFPMLTANGVAQPMEVSPVPGAPAKPAKIKVGPRAVLFAPQMPGGGSPGSWAYIEPSSESVNGLQARLEKKWDSMREIGMQPLAEASITVITSANISVKAKSALQAYTLRLEDAFEQAFVVTALWLGKSAADAPGVDIYKDFGIEQQSDTAVNALIETNKNKELSGETLRAELRRRNILSDNFDEKEEEKRMDEEAANAVEEGDGEDDIDPVTGKALDAANDTGEDDSLDPAAISNPSDISDGALAKFFGARAAGGDA
jgi:hypothetical protein